MTKNHLPWQTGTHIDSLPKQPQQPSNEQPITEQVDWADFAPDFKIKIGTPARIEVIHRALVKNDEDYRRLLLAVYDSQAVEGSMILDDAMAALMIREEAKRRATAEYLEVATTPLQEIVRRLHVVLRRYGMSRKNRREKGTTP